MAIGQKKVLTHALDFGVGNSLWLDENNHVIVSAKDALGNEVTVDLSAAVGGGINQLTGDVAAGPGSGSQAATIQANAVTTAKIIDNAVTTLKILDQAVTLAKLINAGAAGFIGATAAGPWGALTPTQATALLNPATFALPGLQPVDSRLLMTARGADLGDADATLQPFSTGKSLYVMPAATLTATRTFTLGNTSAPGAGVVWVIDVIRLDTSAQQIVWKRADTTTIYTDPGTPAAARHFQFICSNGVWSSNTGSLIA